MATSIIYVISPCPPPQSIGKPQQLSLKIGLLRGKELLHNNWLGSSSVLMMTSFTVVWTLRLEIPLGIIMNLGNLDLPSAIMALTSYGGKIVEVKCDVNNFNEVVDSKLRNLIKSNLHLSNSY